MSEQQKKIVSLFSQLNQLDKLPLISILAKLAYEAEKEVSEEVLAIADKQAERYDTGESPRLNREEFWKNTSQNNEKWLTDS